MTLNSAYISAVLADTPWGFWQMQETSGTSMADGGGGSHGGLYDAAVSSVAGPFSGWTAAHFTTSTAWVSGVFATNTLLSIEMWTLMDGPSPAQGAATVYSDAAHAKGWDYFAVQTAGSGPNAALSMLSPSTTWLWTAHPMFTNTGWQYTVLQHEADGHWRAYMRNAAFGLVTDDIGAYPFDLPTSPNLYIGRRPDGTFPFKGAICAYAFYTHTLTTAQMNAHYNAAAALPPPVPCQYGTRLQAGKPTVVQITDPLLAYALSGKPFAWVATALYIWIGTSLNTQTLCASPPPSFDPPTPEMMLSPVAGANQLLQAVLWNYFCECVPGSPSPTPMPDPTLVEPTGWDPGDSIVVNPTNPCLDLTEVRRMLREVLRQTGMTLTLESVIQRWAVPFSTVLGPSHSGLTATGSFPIKDLIGVQIVITDRGPNRELEGAPNYVWDLGWVSIMDGNGFIQERRITRDVEVWMPRGMQEATICGYMFKTGVAGRITEVLPEP